MSPTETATKPQSTAVATTQPKSVLIDMATRFGMEPAAFEATVRATCMPPDKNGRVPTREEFAAFLLVAKEYKLNPLTKEIYAFTSQGGGIVPIVSIDGWVNLINSHPAMDGVKFDMHHVDVPQDNGTVAQSLVACTCTIYRKDRSHPIEITEYLVECIRNTIPWKMVHRMLRHKSLIQCARYAFGFAGIYDEDEAERIIEAQRAEGPRQQPAKPGDSKIVDVEAETITETTKKTEPAKPAAEKKAEPAKQQAKPAEQKPTQAETKAQPNEGDMPSFGQQQQTTEVVDQETGEVEEQQWPTSDQYIDQINDAINATADEQAVRAVWAELALEEKLKAYPDQNDAKVILKMGQRMYTLRLKAFGVKE